MPSATMPLTPSRQLIAERLVRRVVTLLMQSAPADARAWIDAASAADVTAVEADVATLQTDLDAAEAAVLAAQADADQALADAATAQSTANAAQPGDATLSALAGLTTAADQAIYATGVNTFAMTGLTAAARTVLDDTTVAAMVNTLGGASSTGSGGLVRATSPTLVTPLLGTPANGTLTNCTGFPADQLDSGGNTDRVYGSDGGGNSTLYRIGTSSGQIAAGDHTHTLDQVTNGIQTVVLAADRTNNNASANTIADVTGLSFAVLNGSKYWFRATIFYTAAATTTGSRWSINGPTTTALAYRSRYTITATTETTNAGLSAYDSPAAANSDSLTAGNIAIIEGFVVPSANGTVTVRFASEVSSSAIVAKAGSVLQYQKVA